MLAVSALVLWRRLRAAAAWIFSSNFRAENKVIAGTMPCLAGIAGRLVRRLEGLDGFLCACGPSEVDAELHWSFLPRLQELGMCTPSMRCCFVGWRFPELVLELESSFQS